MGFADSTKIYKKVTIIRGDRRITLVSIVVILMAAALIARLFFLQVVYHGYYREMALGIRSSASKLEAVRGEVYAQNIHDDVRKFPLIVNEDTYLLFADGRTFQGDVKEITETLAEKLQLTEEEKSKILKEMENMENDPYVPLLMSLSEERAQEVRDLKNPGLGLVRNTRRYYPEGEKAAHITGFMGSGERDTKVGKYGFEGYNNDLLAGVQGKVTGEKGAGGGWIPTSARHLQAAQDGPDVVLTIDHNVQRVACEALSKGMKEYEAKSGTVIVMNPKTGAIWALCNEPTFNPNNLKEVSDISRFNNLAIFTPYEPGSVFKPFTIAAGLDTGKLLPTTTFVDTGYEVIDKFTIKNAAEKVYGLSSMRDVLINSINTGTIFAVRSVGKDVFYEYVKKFGFGTLSGVQLDVEVPGVVDTIKQKGEIYMATASFGQGITTTPLQLIAGYAALANHGKLMQPYIIREKDFHDGRIEKTTPKEVAQVVSVRTAATMASMLTAVVEEGHAKPASVKGYRIAGKTGTAQIADPTGGYSDNYNHTFIGFGPSDDAQFVILVKYEHPNQRFADSTTVHTFQDIAEFLVTYLRIPPSR